MKLEVQADVDAVARRGDPAIPAGQVRQDHAVVLADRAAVPLGGT